MVEKASDQSRGRDFVVKAESAMLGYLNALCPFNDEGYMVTVIWWKSTANICVSSGAYLRSSMRAAESLSAEVESVLLQMDNVQDAVVLGEEPHYRAHGDCPGEPAQLEDTPAFKQRMFAFCRDKLAAYKIPVKVETSRKSSTTPDTSGCGADVVGAKE
jgi:hypothetical protein